MRQVGAHIGIVSAVQTRQSLADPSAGLLNIYRGFVVVGSELAFAVEAGRLVYRNWSRLLHHRAAV